MNWLRKGISLCTNLLQIIVKSMLLRQDVVFNRQCIYDYLQGKHWVSYGRNTRKVEEEMWKADELQDDVEPLIIRLTNNSSSSGNQSSQSGSKVGLSWPDPSKTNQPTFEGIQELSDSD
ncbi:hypothetical protein J437_LFUL008124 [Ladona fulva]|uniref:Uncharacterized protein n=1 Tax=Ladona fulva TaxID=123851 RepID=A0A8K0JUK0_LADFU|nr:hypothetical protein J437_LFUL008124 [Ladona fulva]